MSVRGEFQRYLAELLQQLHGSPPGPHTELLEELRALQRAGEPHDLSGNAHRALEALDRALASQPAGAPPADRNLHSACNDLAAISRIILGR